MKNLMNLKGIIVLDKTAQKSVNGSGLSNGRCTLPDGSRCPTFCVCGNCFI